MISQTAPSRQSPNRVGKENTITTYTQATCQAFVDAGLEPKQASVIIDAISRSDSELVTKADLKAELALLLAALSDRIADSKSDMLKVAMGIAIGIVIANVSLTVALVKLLN